MASLFGSLASGVPVGDLTAFDPAGAAELMLEIIKSDNEERFGAVAEYREGRFPDPYLPKGMSGEMVDLMARSRQPWCALPGKAVAQTLAVEGWRSAEGKSESGDGSDLLTDSPEWRIWQRSNLDARQNVPHHAMADYGQAFLLSEIGFDGDAYIRVLSARHTAVLFEDVLSDDNAAWSLTVLAYSGTNRKGEAVPGKAVMWDRELRYEVLLDVDQKVKISGTPVPHGGNGHNPVTRMAVHIDDEGRVVGEIEPIMAWQDSFNQVLFNLLATQTDSAFRTIFGTGLRDEYVLDEQGRPVLDDNGRPVPVPVQIGPGTILTSSDSQSKFGVIPGSDQSGYIESLDMLIKQFAALTQTPPNFLLGTMANMSAEALEAAEKSFRRKVGHYQRAAGESWERSLRVCRVMEGAVETDLLEHGEVSWTDFDKYQMVGVSDALGKLATNLEIPKRGLWSLVPGVSAGLLDEWHRLADEMDELSRLADYGSGSDWSNTFGDDSGDSGDGVVL